MTELTISRPPATPSGRQAAELEVTVWLEADAKAELDNAGRYVALARSRVQTTEPDDVLAESFRELLEHHEWRLIVANLTREQASASFLLRGLTRPEYDALLATHPPTEEQAASGAEYNHETFPAALISACHVGRPHDGVTTDDARAGRDGRLGMTPATATELLGLLSPSGAKWMFATAVIVCMASAEHVGRFDELGALEELVDLVDTADLR
jgi:hypothetical protein